MNKPFSRKVLTKKELKFMDKMFNKLQAAYCRDHKIGRCKIVSCRSHLFLATGTIEHYPNGYYIE